LRRFAIAIMVLAVIGMAALGACGGGDDDDSPVHVDSVTPSSGTIGDEIVIRGRGFDLTNNDVGFYPSGLTGWGDSAFITHVPSADGKTLRVELEDTLGACPESQTGGCEDIGLPLPAGEIGIAVYSQAGTSNRVSFTREGGTMVELARTAVFKAAALQELKTTLEDAVAELIAAGTFASYFIGVGQDEHSEIYVDVSWHGFDVEGLPHAIPEEIAGYEVRVAEN
jgi:hypothetical protein